MPPASLYSSASIQQFSKKHIFRRIYTGVFSLSKIYFQRLKMVLRRQFPQIIKQRLAYPGME
jgi:hypothetical protein